MSCNNCNDCNEDLVPGPVGPKGLQGLKGEPGNSILCGEEDPTKEEGKCEDVYLNTLSGDFFVKDEFCQWVKKGNLKGPTGITSGEGPPTEDGSYCGEVYVDLSTGLTYTWNCETDTWDVGSGTGFQGPEGPQGPQGPEGPQGSAGGDADPADVSFGNWNNVSYNGSTGFQTVSGSAAQYAKMAGSDLVILKGLIKRELSVTTAYNASNVPIFNLPAGYRPVIAQRFSVYFGVINGGNVDNFNDAGKWTIQVQPNGDVIVLKQIGVTVGTETVTWVYDLSNISFRAEQ